nr:MAG TPA: YopX protein [Caudoviricetes sp.]
MTNNRFRFRAWDKSFQKYCENVIVSTINGEITVYERLVNGNTVLIPSAHVVLEQCTGLKDENGKLIYEGDIVRVFYDHFNGTFTEKEVVGPVKWECGTWIVNNSLLNHSPEYDETHLESAAVEVIGNVHENPELLEENNGK